MDDTTSGVREQRPKKDLVEFSVSAERWIHRRHTKHYTLPQHQWWPQPCCYPLVWQTDTSNDWYPRCCGIFSPHISPCIEAVPRETTRLVMSQSPRVSIVVGYLAKGSELRWFCLFLEGFTVVVPLACVSFKFATEVAVRSDLSSSILISLLGVPRCSDWLPSSGSKIELWATIVISASGVSSSLSGTIAWCKVLPLLCHGTGLQW